MLRRPLQLLMLMLASLGVLAAPPSEAAPVEIDDFDVNQPATGSTDTVVDVLIPFGSRTIAVQPADFTVPFAAEIDVIPPDLVVTNTDGVANLQAAVFWPLLPLVGSKDLVAGTNDRFRLEVGSLVGSWTATIAVQDLNSSHLSPDLPLVIGNLDFLFSSFNDSANADFSQIRQVELMLRNVNAAPGDKAIIDELLTTPEPGTACMLALGLLGLGLGSPCRRIV